MSPSFLLIYITTPTPAAARGIAEAVVGEGLAACANIIPGMTSVYRWQGKVEEGRETVLLLKTRAELFPAVEARVKALHAHETPCIVAVPLAAGHAPFLAWVEAETGV